MDTRSTVQDPPSDVAQPMADLRALALDQRPRAAEAGSGGVRPEEEAVVSAL